MVQLHRFEKHTMYLEIFYLWIWKSWIINTDYDSLYPGHILLSEQVLLQPLKVLVGAVHMVLPGPRPLTPTAETRELCYDTQ